MRLGLVLNTYLHDIFIQENDIFIQENEIVHSIWKTVSCRYFLFSWFFLYNNFLQFSFYTVNSKTLYKVFRNAKLWQITIYFTDINIYWSNILLFIFNVIFILKPNFSKIIVIDWESKWIYLSNHDNIF